MAFKGCLLNEIELIDTFVNPLLSMKALSDQIITHWELFQVRLSTSALLIAFLLEFIFSFFDLLHIELKGIELVKQDALITPMISDFLELLAFPEVVTIFVLF